MLKQLIVAVAYGFLRGKAPFLFAAIETVNIINKKYEEIEYKQKEPEDLIKAKKYFGFNENPTEEDIKLKYKELAKIYHPDKESGSEDKMKTLNNYKSILIKHYKVA